MYLLHAAVALILVLASEPIVTSMGPAEAIDDAVVVWWTGSAVMVAGLLVQHRWPLPALLLAGIGAVGHQVSPYIEFPTLLDLAVPITLYTVASRARSRWISVIAVGVLVVAEYAVNLVSLASAAAYVTVDKYPELLKAGKAVTRAAQPPESLMSLLTSAAGSGLSAMLVLGLAVAFGDSTRSRRAHLQTIEQRAADLEREQHQRIALATAAERARISRELHDVVAHSLSVIVAQAQAAVAAQRRHPERTTQAMREVITVGRDSLSEMRRLVGAFGPEQDSDQGLAPQPGLGALAPLVDRVRAAGTPVRLDIDGQLAALPAGVDLSAYRIVQEALTNKLKHAGAGAQASVHLAFRPGYVDVEVTDDGAVRPADPAIEHGNGLRGIAERVTLLGGHLTVGPGQDGGFVVRARLPIRPEQIGASA